MKQADIRVGSYYWGFGSTVHFRLVLRFVMISGEYTGEVEYWDMTKKENAYCKRKTFAAWARFEAQPSIWKKVVK